MRPERSDPCLASRAFDSRPGRTRTPRLEPAGSAHAAASALVWLPALLCEPLRELCRSRLAARRGAAVPLDALWLRAAARAARAEALVRTDRAGGRSLGPLTVVARLVECIEEALDDLLAESSPPRAGGAG